MRKIAVVGLGAVGTVLAVFFEKCWAYSLWYS